LAGKVNCRDVLAPLPYSSAGISSIALRCDNYR